MTQLVPLALLDADVPAYVNAQLTAALAAQSALIVRKNYALNGAMMVNQDGVAVTTTGGYIVDQFNVQFVNGGTISGAQVANPTPGGSTSRLRVTVTASDAAVAAGDYSMVAQPIEGARVADLRWGSGFAKTITIRFGVNAPAGTYCVTVLNSALNRSYVAEYTIAGGESNTDVVKSVTIPGDTSGTWLTNNGVGMWVRWGLMAGATFQQAAGAWGTASAVGSANQFNFMGASVASLFELFDVGVYEGSTVPTFVVPDPIAEKLRCQRYYYKILPGVAGAGIASGVAYSTALMIYAITFPVEMRGTPTTAINALTWRTAGNSGTTSLSASNAGTTGTELQITVGGGPPVAGHGSTLTATTSAGYVAFSARY